MLDCVLDYVALCRILHARDYITGFNRPQILGEKKPSPKARLVELIISYLFHSALKARTLRSHRSSS
jgi:hypothetical protein